MSKSKNLSTNFVHTDTNIIQDGRHFYNIPTIDGSTVIFDKYENFVKSDINEKTADLDKITHTLQNYGRAGSETTLAVEQIISGFENADYTKILPTGLAAIRTAFISFTKNGSHVLVNDGIYAPVKMCFEYFAKKSNIEITYFDPIISEDELLKLTKPNTCLIYAEVPSSRFFEVANITAIVDVAKKIGAISVCDNSYATWINFKPLDNGFDVSVMSLTKYPAGHSDMMCGSISVKKENFRPVFETVTAFGDHFSAQNSVNLLKGMRTMNLRMDQSIKTGFEFIQYLQTKKIVTKIYHPSIKDHIGHEFFTRHFANAPSLMSIALDKIYPEEKLAKMYNSFKLFNMGFSYGGVESLVTPISTENMRLYSKNQPLHHSSMRLYIGIEDINDLIADFEQALSMLS